MRALIGQQVSVKAAATLLARLTQRFGEPVGFSASGLTHFFPTAATVAAASPAQVRAIGLTMARARAIVSLAHAIANGQLDLSAGADPEKAVADLQDLPGVGAWTAHYVAMRALHWPNAFPAGDLVLQKALGVGTGRAAEARAHAWAPWRAYAAVHLWNSFASPSQPKTQLQGALQ
jgi:AraC family transcriptional regulator of adaptative response / DNA-3-methyladenine glycosylase II